MQKLLNEWRKYITEGKCGNSWCESDQKCVDGECVDKQPEPPEEEEAPLEESDWKKKQEAECRQCETDAAAGKSKCTKTRWYAINCEQHDKPAMPWEKKKQPWEEGP